MQYKLWKGLEMKTSDIIALAGLVVAFLSLAWTWKNSRMVNKIKRTNALFELHEKNKSGRRAMSEVYKSWNEDKKAVKDLTESERKEFIDYYNKGFHQKDEGTIERKKSDSIHTCLHNLHHIWRRMKEKEFTKEEILNIFGSAVDIDCDHILLFLDAHWDNENRKTFWQNVPSFVEESKAWVKSESHA
jgi:hypothetical protein